MSLVGSTSFIEQPDRLSKWLKYEVNPDFTRRSKTLLAGSGSARAVLSGQVLGADVRGAQTVTVGTTVGAGTGVLTLANPKAIADAEPGVWQIRFVGKASDAGKAQLISPSGKQKGKITVGVAFDLDIKGTVSDSGTDWDEGDYIPVTVSYASQEKVAGYDQDSTLGYADFGGIAIYDATAADGVDGNVLVIDTGPALVDLDNLIWPDDITTDEKAVVTAAMIAAGIRDSGASG